MTSAIEELVETVKDAHTKEKWNPLEFVKNGGVSLPEKDLDIYIDQAAAFAHDATVVELDDWEKEHIGEMAPPPEGAELKQKIADLRKQVWENRLVLHLRGVAPKWAVIAEKEFDKERRKVQKEHGADADITQINRNEKLDIMRKTIRVITHVSTGDSSNVEFTREEMQDFYDELPDSQKFKLWEWCDSLRTGVELSDRFSDADFLNRGADVAAESAIVEGSEVSS